ncbi:MAG: ABC transporter ATP-binding protein [Armatimonadota bacterium]|nr:ABC transporter ATP-binding protein [Armatimonadota bacterium]MDR7450979.1 ABC transporter ATP-binding protein [Armatimonadota bacterium]MDR7466000.1 ABC transporter ATP-binding protein [Armatimonadota bacterium]MDR7494065.1 ABC transporter ATP-binding protein [Armatimonadota bacterium]MDR7504068.1 ABC transporter ATP-binding protein [Armatimonadota bacterium]
MLKVSEIDVLYGSFQALWGVSLEVRAGEMVALVGANSSGKSTLLNAISGFLRPARGRIEFEGRDITRDDPWRTVDLGIAHVPEGRRLFPDLTVLDNLILGSYSARARARRAANLDAVFTLFPRLAQRRHQVAKTLSGGEQQMLALGRGLMSAPALLLLDEMSLGLAPVVVGELYRTLQQIRAAGVAILFVEQNVKQSLGQADRAYILEKGRIVLSGEAAVLRETEEVKRAYFGV